MIRLFDRRTRIAIERVRRKKSPFVYKAFSKKEKHRHLRKRKTKELIFQRLGLAAITIAALFLFALLWNILSSGVSSFQETDIRLPVTFTEKSVETNDFRQVVQQAIFNAFPNIQDRKGKRELLALISRDAPYVLQDTILENPEYKGQTKKVWLPASSAVSVFYKRHFYEQSDRSGKISPTQIQWINDLARAKDMRLRFNLPFFTNGDSREAESAGVAASTVGSFLTIIICILMTLPIGVATAVYLEEFAPKNWFSDFIEININNLAAVPSIIFGLLGLAVYLNFFGLPRSSSLVGGMVLALLVLPIIVIATRNALRAVPPSIRYAAAALGATPTQVVFHHTLVYALPGIMTGVILSISRAFGETAPLLMIGMVAFIADIPGSFTEPATTLPVQVYLWSNNPELGFVEKTAAAIMVLLGFMICINLLAIYIRKRFEIKW